MLSDVCWLHFVFDCFYSMFNDMNNPEKMTDIVTFDEERICTECRSRILSLPHSVFFFWAYLNQRSKSEMLRETECTIKAWHDTINICLIKTINMTNCEHIAWLQSVDNKESQLHDEDQIKQVLEKMSRSSEQCPSIVFFIGQKAKNTVLYELFPFNNVR